jgi:uncharacterized FlaG/YvyC family protein
MKVKPMEIKLPLGDAFYPNKSADSDLFKSRITSVGANTDKDAAGQAIFQSNKDDLREILEQTIELVSIFERNLKFEVVEDVGILQIQVINASDGTIIRKIPPDEIIKLITHIKDKWSSNINVLA